MNVVEIQTKVLGGLPVTVKGYSYDRRTIGDFAIVGCGSRYSARRSAFDWINRRLDSAECEAITDELEQALRGC